MSIDARDAQVRIVEVDPHDDTLLAAFHATEHAAHRADRPHAVLRSLAAVRDLVRTPSDYHRHTLLVALDGDRVVGVAELGLELGDNEHLADLEVAVLPTHRRRGIGRALWDEGTRRSRAEGRTSALAEVSVPGDLPPESAAPYAFARSVGLRSVHTEDHLVLDLPVPPDEVVRLRARVADVAGYGVVTWGNRCPDEHAAGYCAMKSQMASDVPIGEVDWTPTTYTETKLREFESRIVDTYHQVIAAVRRDDGGFAGYSQVLMTVGDAMAIQDDTLVMPADRGHRLGILLKLATLEIVQREHPDRTSFHTWTDPDNAAMLRTNLDFGYRVVERMHEMQLTD